MKQYVKLRERGKDIIDTILRFPLMIVFLFAAVITNAVSIQQEYDETYIKILVTFILGACIYAVFQMIYERFCIKTFYRYLFMIITISLTFLYYVVIKDARWDAWVTVSTTVIFFNLLIAFLWVPVIQSRYNFNDSFMAAFKAFFATLFFNGILFLGIVLIIGVTDLLLLEVNEKVYRHTANVIFILFAPIQFLSLIPYYPGNQVDSQEEKQKRENTIKKLVTPVKFLETLISYVVIPITVVFTIVLLLYILMNITGDFWKDNLMEPLLVAYSTTVIIVYLLSSTMHNEFTKYFRMIFPKVMIPVVLLQTLASILKISDNGITYGRYYAILFGIFATVSAILFCVVPIYKNGMIAPILIILSVISILPITGAFSVSKANQIGRLQQVLEKNNMLKNDTIIANAGISEKDKSTIVSSIDYIDRMEYSDDVSWLKEYDQTHDFERTFGFKQYENSKDSNRYVAINRNQSSPIPVSGYDYMVRMYLYGNGSNVNANRFEKNGKVYQLKLEGRYEDGYEIVLYEEEKELINFSTKEIYDRFMNNGEKSLVETNEVTFIQENDRAILNIVAETININQWEGTIDKNADIYVLVKIK